MARSKVKRATVTERGLKLPVTDIILTRVGVDGGEENGQKGCPAVATTFTGGSLYGDDC